ncbi:MAG: molybdate ABC transporter substrate-binding protein [Planctomycetes bacterium]|nr:molybdate ABC transporter substrate-binding protein [Planctomycetota bacterium]
MKNGIFIAAGVSILAIVGLLFLLKEDPRPTGDDQETGKPLELYCAMGMNKPMKEIIADYEETYGVRIVTQFAGSGTLLGSIQAAGTADLYLAADVAYMKTAEERGIKVREQFHIASQQPVIAVHKGNPLGIKGIDDLLSSSKVRLSLADPELAAIARAARKRLGDEIWDRLWAMKLTARATVTELANDVELEENAASIIWDATARQYRNIDIIPVPEFQTSKNAITIAVLGSSKRPTSALRFARYLTAPDKGLKAFEKFHYETVPGGDLWGDGTPPEIMFYAGGLNEVAVRDTISQFAKREGCKVATLFTGCGALVGRMKAADQGGLGEQPDIYFSCDRSYMSKVQQLFYEPIDVSGTDIVLIVKPGNPDQINSLKDLADAKGIKIGLCHPVDSALGVLSRNLLKKAGHLGAIQAKLYDEPATAPLLVAKVAAKGLDAAIVYRANAQAMQQAGKVEIIDIDDPTARAFQNIAIGKFSHHKHLSRRLIDAIVSGASREQFETLGFDWLADEPKSKASGP